MWHSAGGNVNLAIKPWSQRRHSRWDFFCIQFTYSLTYSKNVLCEIPFFQIFEQSRLCVKHDFLVCVRLVCIIMFMLGDRSVSWEDCNICFAIYKARLWSCSDNKLAGLFSNQITNLREHAFKLLMKTGDSITEPKFHFKYYVKSCGSKHSFWWCCRKNGNLRG